MKQTAVEWLYERMERMIPRSALYNIDKIQYFEQAKEMEKEQMWHYIKMNYVNGDNSFEYHRKEFQQYYQETYKSK